MFALVREKLPHLSVLLVATVFGFVRGSGYYQPKRQTTDAVLKEQIVATLSDHPSYGYRRIALALGIGKKRVQRVMHVFKVSSVQTERQMAQAQG